MTPEVPANPPTLDSGIGSPKASGVAGWGCFRVALAPVRPLAVALTLVLASQLAYGQDGQLKGFAVLEYESAEAAEMVQQATDGLLLAGNHVRVSFCAPGPPGRSMLAALIAAQATVRLLPPPLPPRSLFPSQLAIASVPKVGHPAWSRLLCHVSHRIPPRSSRLLPLAPASWRLRAPLARRKFRLRCHISAKFGAGTPKSRGCSAGRASPGRCRAGRGVTDRLPLHLGVRQLSGWLGRSLPA